MRPPGLRPDKGSLNVGVSNVTVLVNKYHATFVRLWLSALSLAPEQHRTEDQREKQHDEPRRPPQRRQHLQGRHRWNLRRHFKVAFPRPFGSGRRHSLAELKSSIDVQLSRADVAQSWRFTLKAGRQGDLLFVTFGPPGVASGAFPPT